MNFLFESVASVLTNLAKGVATTCMWFFYEPEVPVSLREE